MEIVIVGHPVAQERPRKGMHGNFYDPSAKVKKTLGMQILVWRQEAQASILGGDVSVYASFHVSTGKGDLDNFVKALLDAANGILWEDDRQVKHIDAWLHACENGSERTIMRVTAL